MTKAWLRGLGIALMAGSVIAHAGPREERTKLVDYFARKFPDLRHADHVYGALAFDPDARDQYDAIMEYPPFTAELEKAKLLFETPFRNGKTYADCLPNGGRMIAGNYPLFDEARGRVVTFEDLINQCRADNGEEPYAYDDPGTMGLVTAHARSLSDGMKVDVKVESPAALRAFEAGKREFYQRMGQLNFSCASCHVAAAGNRLRSEVLSTATGQAVHWPVFRGGDQPMTLQMRYTDCYRYMRHVSDRPGSERLNNLEYFHTYLSNGLEMKASVFRK
ncbi:MAG TPA: sulfur oxidation c-type cytochrome SoxA [Thiobacillaceae bacterium]|nr:sulfur oxidation c-type cytochrome SoxA [Thiobacillaceae bacterium]HNU64096.1 sulfur oxidation c-type cytochrome SoxA [Thiobacillaceae bacterium]